jgi:hypothetical protein
MLRADRGLSEARYLVEEDSEARDGKPKGHQRDPGADPGEHCPLVRLVQAECLFPRLRGIKHDETSYRRVERDPHVPLGVLPGERLERQVQPRAES